MSNWSIDREGISCTINGPVAILKVNRPETKNGLDWKAKMVQAEAYNHIAEDPDVKVLVFAADGDYFWTGGRVDAGDPENKRLYSESIAKVEEGRRKLKIPMIAAVSGHCIKGGIGIVAQSDLAIAKDSATFSFPEVKMGGAPMVVMAKCMRYLPKKFALEAYYSGAEYSAQRMYEIGFLNAVTDEEHFWPTVEQYINMIVEGQANVIQDIHIGYMEMEQIYDDLERIDFSQSMLKNKVLTHMNKENSKYNIDK